jgi:hypothetical protein
LFTEPLPSIQSQIGDNAKTNAKGRNDFDLDQGSLGNASALG